MKNLLDQKELHRTDVVANNLMNRERRCLGKNSYQKDLSFNPIEFIRKRFISNGFASWLDICCGTGRALIETAGYFTEKYPHKKLSNNLQIIGIDLAGGFDEYSSEVKFLNLLEMAIEDFKIKRKFDLVTCVHGLHYIGDKLSVIRRAAAMLKDDGIFLANLDINNLKLIEEENSTGIFSKLLKINNFAVNRRKNLISRAGKSETDFPLKYIGADSQAGPNYTGQAAVNSYYRIKGINKFS